ncbi:Type IV pilus assembly protein PilO, partial [human gut metagenome]
IPKINDEIKSYLKWTLNNTYGKTVPFNTGAATGVEKSEKDSSDFVIGAKSINSDLSFELTRPSLITFIDILLFETGANCIPLPL